MTTSMMNVWVYQVAQIKPMFSVLQKDSGLLRIMVYFGIPSSPIDVLKAYKNDLCKKEIPLAPSTSSSISMSRTMKQREKTNRNVMKHMINGIKSSRQLLIIYTRKPNFSKILMKNIILAKLSKTRNSFSSGRKICMSAVLLGSEKLMYTKNINAINWKKSVIFQPVKYSIFYFLICVISIKNKMACGNMHILSRF